MVPESMLTPSSACSTPVLYHRVEKGVEQNDLATGGAQLGFWFRCQGARCGNKERTGSHQKEHYESVQRCGL